MKISINWKEYLNKKEFDVGLLQPKSSLHPSLWRREALNPQILSRLVEISEDILRTENIDAEIEDIIVTGSLASYNWNRLSDLDLHILLDFDQINENRSLVRKYLNAIRVNWNLKHSIMIENHEVELYFQDVQESHHADGVYSILSEDWVKRPTLNQYDVDMRTVEKKAEGIAVLQEQAFELFREEKYENVHKLASKLMKKIKRMRMQGLSTEGIYSVENLAFKMLRNAGIIYKIASLRDLSYDKKMSLIV